jgi:hypothetical protein
MSEDRMKYLVMRCTACKGFLTRLEIVKAWEEMESSGSKKKGICPCGGRQVKATNLTPEEEKKYTGIWPRILYFLGVRNNKTRVIELYEKCVKGKDLGKEYK